MLYKSERPLFMLLVSLSHDYATDILPKDMALSPNSKDTTTYRFAIAESKIRSSSSTTMASSLDRLGPLYTTAYLTSLLPPIEHHRGLPRYCLVPRHTIFVTYEDFLTTLKWALSHGKSWLITHGVPSPPTTYSSLAIIMLEKRATTSPYAQTSKTLGSEASCSSTRGFRGKKLMDGES
jgi:hypothetical protein